MPATEATQHLLLISGLARLAKQDPLVQKLHAAQDTFQILEVLRQIKLRTHPVPDTLKAAVT